MLTREGGCRAHSCGRLHSTTTNLMVQVSITLANHHHHHHHHRFITLYMLSNYISKGYFELQPRHFLSLFSCNDLRILMKQTIFTISIDDVGLHFQSSCDFCFRLTLLFFFCLFTAKIRWHSKWMFFSFWKFFSWKLFEQFNLL